MACVFGDFLLYFTLLSFTYLITLFSCLSYIIFSLPSSIPSLFFFFLPSSSYPLPLLLPSFFSSFSIPHSFFSTLLYHSLSFLLLVVFLLMFLSRIFHLSWCFFSFRIIYICKLFLSSFSFISYSIQPTFTSISPLSPIPDPR